MKITTKTMSSVLHVNRDYVQAERGLKKFISAYPAGKNLPEAKKLLKEYGRKP